VEEAAGGAVVGLLREADDGDCALPKRSIRVEPVHERLDLVFPEIGVGHREVPC
jgi:hypothetical protein